MELGILCRRRNRTMWENMKKWEMGENKRNNDIMIPTTTARRDASVQVATANL
jgi:hypothetical protein